MSASDAFSHLNEQGAARMVDVGAKPDVKRTAVATGRLTCAPKTIELLRARALPKGDVLTVAKIAGIQGAKVTSQLIPLCHPLALSHLDLDFTVEDTGIVIRATASLVGKTGVEMEALTAVSVAALTLYDMCKAVDKGMVIDAVRVIEKTKG